MLAASWIITVGCDHTLRREGCMTSMASLDMKKQITRSTYDEITQILCANPKSHSIYADIIDYVNGGGVDEDENKNSEISKECPNKDKPVEGTK